jgi:hypothetical protein
MRKVIFECRTGSHLYGTNTPPSDEDFCGIFLPDVSDVLGLGSPPDELNLGTRKEPGTANKPGDVDCKHIILRKFIKMLGEGQPLALEMLFAPPACVAVKTEEWESIKPMLLAAVRGTAGVAPFLGFARAQAHRSTMRIETFTLLHDMTRFFDGFSNESLNTPLKVWAPEMLHEFGCRGLKKETNDRGAELLVVAGRRYDFGLKTKFFLGCVLDSLQQNGSRVRLAAGEGIDNEALMHAYRLCHEAEEFVTTGHITLPLPAETVAFLLSVRRNERDDDDHLSILNEKIQRVEALSPKRDANWASLRDIHFATLMAHFQLGVR